MESYDFLFILAIILLSTKVFGLLTERVRLPQVVGALLAGIILGPSCLGVLQETDFLQKSAEIGVIMLMFLAGVDTDLEELKNTGAASLLIAVLGVFITIVACAAVYYFFFVDSFTSENIVKSVFVGVIFASTSVSITVETLNEMGKLKTKVGTALVSAAIIDDVLGIISLSVISGFVESNVSQVIIIGKIFGFFLFTAFVGVIVHYIFEILDANHAKSKRVTVWALAFCFIMSYAAEEFFGVADITGAYFAGLILCNIAKTKQAVAKKITVSSYVFFSPIFFASVGIKTNIAGMSNEIILFAAVLLVVVILTKIIGCGVGAKICKMTNRQALGIGIGMVARGEVSLMIAQKGIELGIIDERVFPAAILVVALTILISPALLNLVMREYRESSKTVEVTAQV